MADYPDIIDAPDLKHKPQVNEYEFNPFLLYSPTFRELHFYEVKHGIVNMSRAIPCTRGTSAADYGIDYGFLTAISGRLPEESSSNLRRVLQDHSAKTGKTAADLILAWAYHRLNGIVVTSTAKAERASSSFKLLSPGSEALPEAVYIDIEKAAEADGHEGKVFYKHPHMEKAAAQAR